MPWIPKDAKWYLAELVVVYRTEGEFEAPAHISFILVAANTPDEAYERAHLHGAAENNESRDSGGRATSVCFAGLRNLHVIYDELECFEEVIYEELDGLSEEAVQRLVRPKASLNVFLVSEVDGCGSSKAEGVTWRLRRE